jgi:hypothetical protein
MVVVRSVEEFAKKNEEDLRRFMAYRTGIFDKDLVDDAIQEFYKKLIETRALETFDAGEGAFNTYITNLFCWSLPSHRKKNFRINFDVLSSVSVANGSSIEKNVDVWDFVSRKGHTTVEFEPKKRVSKRDAKEDNSGRTPTMNFNVDARFHCSVLESQKEDDFIREMDDFKSFIRSTEKETKADRMITYINGKLSGCLNTDIATVLNMSTTMIRHIKKESKEKYLKWKKGDV